MATVSKDKLFTRSYILVCVANFLTSFSFFLLVPTLPFYLADVYGVSSDVVGLVLSCYVVAVLCIRPFAGFVADIFPRKRVYIISYMLLSVKRGSGNALIHSKTSAYGII